MLLDINKVRTTPPDHDADFCVYGEPNEEVSAWIKHHNMSTEKSGDFTNINMFGVSYNDVFEKGYIQYQYVDGFSPNLNKHLHIGHLSNLIYAKAFQGRMVGYDFIAILGDTLEGEVTKEEALESYKQYCTEFDYEVEKIYFASEMKYEGDLLKDGAGDYEGTKVFDIDGVKKVGIKSDGSTSYFYQDVALAEQLKEPTLYLTGVEQEEHFSTLKKLYPQIDHVGLGLVTIDGKKASSRDGNAIYAKDVLDKIIEIGNFKGTIEEQRKIAYNIIAGQILKTTPSNNKEIDMKKIANVKTSDGLYLTYTLARMKSTGLEYDEKYTFQDYGLKFIALKSTINLNPSLLFKSLVSLCKTINSLYGKHSIKDDPKNAHMFKHLVEDLEYGMKTLGMFSIDRI